MKADALLSMSTQILTTKLFIPPPPPRVVPRPRLIERLNEGLRCKLTLIAAPAGFGKTTLLSEWLAGLRGDRQVAWLSLDAGDSDPVRYLTYLVAAVRTVAPGIGADVLAALQSPQPPPAESILTALLNEISAMPAVEDMFILVLDDYHLIDAPAVDLALAFLLEHMPPRMRLIITTREDPQLPLARLRARGQLCELRAGDLRCTASEAAAFLNEAMGLNLSAEQIAALETRTEGWIAGLQLAALSMQNHRDVAGFIRAFAGDHRYIADYLVEEVLQRQPEPVHRFLLQTSILDRLHGPLCDAVTGQEDGAARLEALARGNFFVVTLDDQRRWYRYHHLFADVLYAHLLAEQPGQVATLHRRASAWFEKQDFTADAIRHALAAGDFAPAADLVERALPAMRRTREVGSMLGWLQALPDALIRSRPALSVQYADALLSTGQLAGVEDRLRDAERWLDAVDRQADPRARPGDTAAMIVVDEESVGRLPAEIAVARAAQALALGDVPAAVRHARRLQGLIPEDDPLGRGSAAALLGLASWMSGDLETGRRAFAEGMAHLQQAGYFADSVGGAIAIADMLIAQGRLHEAVRAYDQALDLATGQRAEGTGPVLPGTADLYVGMSEILRERNELQAAAQRLLKCKELGEDTGFPQNRYRWMVAMARLREAEQDPDGALDLLQQAERVYIRDFFPNVRPVAALKARVWVAQGKLGDARDWARAQSLSAQDDLSYLREFEHITLARVLLALYQSDGVDRVLRDAVGLLERLLRAAEEGARTGSAIEILILQALAQQVQGEIAAALLPLERALALAEPEGYVRIFVDEGAPMAQLLHEAAKQGVAASYVRRLLAALGEAADRAPAHAVLAEPLSARELEVLRLLSTELTGPEIARELMVSLPTVRTHTNNIYTKLAMNNRRAAVRRAEELGLL
jgi:LuxR family transcriptional regulator, maltose regulon positive regulatory protein